MLNDFCEIVDRNELAMVGRVLKLDPIPNKYNIELCYIADCGLTFVVQKGYKPGDLVVYIKYDTVVPNTELFAFMADSKFRVKAKAFTEKDEFDNVIKKIYSQGIVLNKWNVVNELIKSFPQVQEDLKGYSPLDTEAEFANMFIEEGKDLTTELGIKKYIPPANNGGNSMGNMQSAGDFPTHLVNKTDEVNCAGKVLALEEIQGMDIYITQKLEGSSLTAYHDDNGEFCVCSRNNKLRENDNKFWQAVRNSGLKEKLANIPDIIVQGELVGPGIQKNKLGLSEPRVYIFNMVRERDRQLLSYPEMKCIADEYGIDLVPLVARVPNFGMSFDELQELSDRQYYNVTAPEYQCLGGVRAEGIVVRPEFPFRSYVLKTDWSVKVINRNYSL